MTCIQNSSFYQQRYFAIVAAIASLIWYSPAKATDKKSYPAQMCQELGSGESGDINRSEYRLARTANSTGFNGGWVICPIVRDTFSGSYGNPAPGMTVDVYVNDQHPLAIECSLIYQNYDGSGIRYNNASSAGYGSQRLRMSHNNAHGVYQVKCKLPQHGNPSGYTRFHSYVVYE